MKAGPQKTGLGTSSPEFCGTFGVLQGGSAEGFT